MTALTIRKIPTIVEKAIRKKATNEHISLNKAVVEMLLDSVNGSKENKKTLYHDLDWMIGSTDKSLGTELHKQLSVLRTIDKELWK